jgi:hypothetical protein
MAMTIPDPDKDLLDKIDRRERRAEFRSAVVAGAVGMATAMAAYALMTSGFGWPSSIARDVAIVAFIGCALLLFVKLSKSS